MTPDSSEGAARESREEIQRLSEAIDALLSGAISPGEFRRRRVIYGIYPVRGASDRYLIRVRIPLGRPTPTHLRALADAAERFTSTRSVHLTTRQDVHIYGIEIRRIPEALTFLAEWGLTTREACGDTVRNIVVCPHAGIARDEIFDVTPCAEALGTWLLRNPIGQRLPRKFKIAFEGCAREDHVGLGIHDVGARAVIGPCGRPGFRLTLAGGLGALPRAGIELEPFTPICDFPPTVEAVLRLFGRLGNRENRGRARLKFVAEKMGPDAIREAVIAERHAVIATASGQRLILPDADVVPSDSPVGAVDGFQVWPGALRQRQPGRVALPIRVPLGDVTASQLRQLSDLVSEMGAEIRLTPAQGMILAYLAEERVGEASARLRPVGFFPPASVAMTRCAGIDTCTVGTTRVRALAALLEIELSSLMSAAGAADITVKISGCANGCGHHLLADIGLQGVAGNAGGRLAPLYTLFLGGGIRQEGRRIRLGEPVGRIPVRRVPEALRRTIRIVRAEMRDGELPSEAIERMGIAPFAERLKELIDPPARSFTDDDFLDLGPPKPFPPSRTDPKAP
jgi:ferredoxin-nitrite reductase/sulfite reductase (ferredoxin)